MKLHSHLKVDRQKNRQIQIQKDIYTFQRQIDIWLYRQFKYIITYSRQIDRQLDRKREKKTDIQINRLIDKIVHLNIQIYRWTDGQIYTDN